MSSEEPESDVVATWATRMTMLPLLAVRTAVTLRLPEALANGSDIEAMSAQLEIDPTATRVLVRYLGTLGLVETDDRDMARLSATGRLLLIDHPTGLAQHWDMMSIAWRMDQALTDLPDVVRRGRPGYPAVHGRTLYEDVDADAQLVDEVLTSAEPLVEYAATRLATWLDIPEEARVMDVGCGAGVHLVRLLQYHPSAQGIAVDLSGTLTRARARWQSSGVENRITTVASDFERDRLPEADVCLLSNVLVDLDDTRATRLLRRVRSSSPRATIVLLELDLDVTDPALAAHLSLHQLCMTGGRVRSLAELRALGSSAGLLMERTEHFGGGVTALAFAPRL